MSHKKFIDTLKQCIEAEDQGVELTFSLETAKSIVDLQRSHDWLLTVVDSMMKHVKSDKPHLELYSIPITQAALDAIKPELEKCRQKN